jgi:hypothetical protein
MKKQANTKNVDLDERYNSTTEIQRTKTRHYRREKKTIAEQLHTNMIWGKKSIHQYITPLPPPPTVHWELASDTTNTTSNDLSLALRTLPYVHVLLLYCYVVVLDSYLDVISFLAVSHHFASSLSMGPAVAPSFLR